MGERQLVRLALRNRLLTVNGLPDAKAWTNVDYTPAVGTPYLAESFSQDTRTLRTMAPNGVVATTGLYIVQWYGLADTAAKAIDDGVDAILAAFPPALALPLEDGTVVRIRGDFAPRAGDILPTGDGWAVCTVTIPWRREALLAA